MACTPRLASPIHIHRHRPLLGSIHTPQLPPIAHRLLRETAAAGTGVHADHGHRARDRCILGDEEGCYARQSNIFQAGNTHAPDAAAGRCKEKADAAAGVRLPMIWNDREKDHNARPVTRKSGRRDCFRHET